MQTLFFCLTFGNPSNAGHRISMFAPAVIWTFSKQFDCWQATTAERPGDGFIHVRERVDRAGWLISVMHRPFPRPMVVVANHLFARKMVEAWHRRNWDRIPDRPWPTIRPPKLSAENDGGELYTSDNGADGTV